MGRTRSQWAGGREIEGEVPGTVRGRVSMAGIEVNSKDDQPFQKLPPNQKAPKGLRGPTPASPRVTHQVKVGGPRSVEGFSFV